MKVNLLKSHGWGGGIRTQYDLVQRHLGTVLRHLTCARLINVVRVGIDVSLRRRRAGGRPLVIKVEPTNICNFRCPGCRTGSGEDKSPRGEMDLANYKKIIDKLYRHAFKVILYMWGEPLINRDVFEMVRYAQSKNLATQISSNMNVFRPGYADAIVESGLEHLIVAFDGVTQETYEKYRVNGKLQKVIDNVRAVLAARQARKRTFPTLELQFIVFPHNRHEIGRVQALAEELGVDKLTIIDSVGNNDKQTAAFDKSGKRRDPDACNALYLMACFNWDGSFSPCCDSVDDSFGNVLETDFDQLWNGEKTIKSRSLHTKHPIQGGVKTKCERCRIYGSYVTFLPEPTPVELGTVRVENAEVNGATGEPQRAGPA